MNHFTKDCGAKSFVALLRYTKANLFLRWSTLLHHLIEHIRQETHIISLNTRPSIVFFKYSPLTILEWNSAHDISQYKATQIFLEKNISPQQWNKLNLNIRNSETL